MASNAGYGYFNFTWRMRQPFDFNYLRRSIPRTNGFEILILGYNFHSIVAFDLASMLTVGGVIFQSTNLLAGWTISLMAVMRIGVVTL